MPIPSFASQRVRVIPPSGIRKFFDIAATMDDVISLGIGEPDFDTPAPIVQAGIEALQRGATHYTSNSGLLELREALSAHLTGLYNVAYDPAQEILVSVGVSEALYLAMAAVLDPGDEILIADPGFVAYEPTARMVDAVPVLIATSPDTQFGLTAAAVEQAIIDSQAAGARHAAGARQAAGARTKALLLASPNNPTGAVIEREELHRIAEVAAKYDLVVISDEIYDRLVYDVEHVCFAGIDGMRERTILLQGFSKAYAMTGWRVGYLAAPATLSAEIRKLHQYLIMSAPTASQWAALKALEIGEPFVQAMHAEYDRRRRLIVQGLNSLGMACTEPHGAFYAFPCIERTGMDDELFAEQLLQEERVAVIPGRAFGKSGIGFVRMSYATAYEKIEVALERIARFVQRHSHGV